MLRHTKSTSQRYRDSLERQRNEREEGQKNLKRKIHDDEIKAVRQKRRLLQAEIQDLTQEVDKLAIKRRKRVT